MAQVSKIDAAVSLKTPADKLYQTMKSKASNAPQMCPKVFRNVEVQDSNSSNDCYINWTFNVDGKVESTNDRVEVDDEARSITYYVVDGECLKQYKSFKACLEVVPEGESGSMAKWRFDYEKRHDGVPDPHKYMEVATSLVRDVGTYLLTVA